MGESYLTRMVAAIGDATLYCPTIKTVILGYVDELATGQIDFDALLLLPPVVTIEEGKSWALCNLHYFMVRQDKTDEGRQMNHDERIAAWSELHLANKVFMEKLGASDNAIRVGNVTIDLNSSAANQLIPDAAIWIEVKVTFRVNDC
jgi:hypothetical protein